MALADNADAITRWRDALDDATRRRWNHPQSLWQHWRKSLGAAKPTARRDYVKSDKPKNDAPKALRAGGSRRQIHWPGEMIWAGAMAMRSTGAADWLVLARACLEAALPDQTALIALCCPL